MTVTFQVDLARFGTVTVTADVSVGRPAPLAVSEATFLDGGDASEVELVGAWSQDEDGSEVSVLALLTTEEREACEREALEWAQAPHGLED